MAAYLLTAVTADGYGLTHHWGDAWEVRADSYEAAEADVLGRVGTDGKQCYDRIVGGWVKDGGVWAELPVARAMTLEELALTVSCPACRVGTGERCRRLKAIGMSRVVTSRRNLRPHPVRVSKAKKNQKGS